MQNQNIKKIRILSFYLFLSASISIIGALSLHNYLVEFNFEHPNSISKNLIDKPGSFYEEICDESNEYCTNPEFIKYWHELENKLGSCFKYQIDGAKFTIDDKIYLVEDIYKLEKNKTFVESSYKVLREEFKNKHIKIRTFVEDGLNPYCINNTKSKKYYKIFPFFYDSIGKIKKQNLNLATSNKINPFIYGETSISNLVKRYPINYLFKSFLYFSVILMFLYWINYNKFFNKTFDSTKNIFFYLGICSAIFLFFHILFLGWESNSELFQKLRRLIIVLFILFEILAQVFLAKNLYQKKQSLVNYCYLKIILLKVYFVSFICISTLIILFGLMFFNYPSSIDYILEWNYFLILLFFYLLSSIMWKKN